MRRLLVTRRTVPLDRLDDYLATWARLRADVQARGGAAWLFRGDGHDDRFLEFLEWSGDTAVAAADDVRAALDELDETASAAHQDTWNEVEP